MQEPLPVREEAHRVGEGQELADHGGERRPLYAHVQHEDEYGVEYGVGNDSEQGQSHRRPGVAGRPDDSVEAEIKVREDVAQQDDDHVVPREGDGVVAGSEEVEYGIQEAEGEGSEDDAYDEIERQDGGKDLLRLFIVLLPEEHGDEGHRSHAHEGAEGGGQVHQREGDRKAGDRVRAHVPDVADVDAVHHIVQRRRSHGDDARDCVHLQKFSYAQRAEFGRSRSA